MKAKYQTQFDINRSELEVIEYALRAQVTNLSLKMLTEQEKENNEESNKEAQLKSRMNDIQSVIGNLHNQKVWFRSNEPVPLG